MSTVDLACNYIVKPVLSFTSGVLTAKHKIALQDQPNIEFETCSAMKPMF